jgi:hypothetical protein
MPVIGGLRQKSLKIRTGLYLSRWANLAEDLQFQRNNDEYLNEILLVITKSRTIKSSQRPADQQRTCIRRLPNQPIRVKIRVFLLCYVMQVWGWEYTINVNPDRNKNKDKKVLKVDDQEDFEKSGLKSMMDNVEDTKKRAFVV